MHLESSNTGSTILQQNQFFDIPVAPVIQNVTLGLNNAVGLLPEVDGLDEYSPTWTTSPPPFAPFLINLNFLPNFIAEVGAMREIRGTPSPHS